MRGTYRDDMPTRTTRAAAGLAVIGAAAVVVARRLLRGLGVTDPSHGPGASAEELTPDDLDRLRAHAMKAATDPAGERFRDEVAAERAAGIPAERMIGRAELTARRHSVRQH